MALGKKPIEIINEGTHQLLVKADHWGRIDLKEVAKVQNGYAFSSAQFTKNDGLPLIRIRDIDRTTTVDRYNGAYNDDYIVKKGDILVGMDGDFNVAKWKGKDGLLNQRVCRIIPHSESYNEKFLFLCLQPYLNAINSETSSVTVKHLSSKTIEEIPLPNPPITEQNQIVEKIEELFSELDKGIENLKTTQQQLKVYRQAVLKWAFEGKLTNENVKDGELPEGWETTTIGNHVDCIVPNRDKPKTFSGNIPWLTTPSLHGEFINVDYTKIKLGLTEEEATLYKAKIIPINSVVMTCVGTFGIAVVLSKEAIINQQLHAFLPSETFLPKYLAYNIKNQKNYCEKTSTTTTIAYLNKTNCNSIPILLAQ